MKKSAMIHLLAVTIALLAPLNALSQTYNTDDTVYIKSLDISSLQGSYQTPQYDIGIQQYKTDPLGLNTSESWNYAVPYSYSNSFYGPGNYSYSDSSNMSISMNINTHKFSIDIPYTWNHSGVEYEYNNVNNFYEFSNLKLAKTTTTSGNYTITTNPSEVYTYGRNEGSGYLQVNVKVNDFPKFPEGNFTSTTYTPPSIPSGQMRIQQVMNDHFTSQDFSGTPLQSSLSTNKVLFNPELGTLSNTTINLSSVIGLGAPTITNSGPGSTVVSVSSTVDFNLGKNYGLNNVSLNSPVFNSTVNNGDGSVIGSFTKAGSFFYQGNETISSNGTQGRGGSIPYTVSMQSTPGSGSISGDWTVSTHAVVSLTYAPFTAQKYLGDALGRSNSPGFGSPDIAYFMQKDLQSLRQWDAFTSQYNLDLRNAEYWALGYMGGRALKGDLAYGVGGSIDDKLRSMFFSSIQSLDLIGLPVYAFLDKQFSGWFGSLPSSNKDFSATSANTDGFLAGLNNVPFSVAIANYLGNSFDPSTIISDTLTNSLDNPIVPLMNIDVGEHGDMNGSLFTFFVDDVSKALYIDPIASKTLEYQVYNNNFTSFEWLSLPTQDIGSFYLEFLGHKILVNSGDNINFLLYSSSGIDEFKIFLDDMNLSLLSGDPILLLQFSNRGLTTMNVFSSDTQNIATPEPSTVFLMISGAFVAFLMRRKAQRN